MQHPKTEKGIATVVFIFNCLTNLLMILPAFLFAIVLSGERVGGTPDLIFAVIGMPAIIFSYWYSVKFISFWFGAKHDPSKAHELWVLSVFHYGAFLAYSFCMFALLFELAFWEPYLILAIVVVPLIFSFSGIYENRKNAFEASTDNSKDPEISQNPNHADEGLQPVPAQNPNQMTSTESNHPTSSNGGSGFSRFSQWLKESIVVKLLAIGFLVLILLIPNAMISDLISERQIRQHEVTAEVSQSWGGYQSVTGPVLSIPYSTWTVYADGKRSENLNTAYFLPKTLNVDGNLPHQIRKRSIFEVVLYQAELQLAGEFEAPDFEALHIPPEDIHWEQARLSVGISGMTGIKEMVEVDWNGQTFQMEPGTASPKLLASGVSTEVDVSAEGGSFSFNIPVKLNGSTGIRFEPVGKSTNVTLRSDWASPSFTGAFLPDEREISKDGFTASWQVLDLNRSYPQQWKNDEVSFGNQGSPNQHDYRYSDFVNPQISDGSTLAVRLVQPVDQYLKNTRSAKYSILVIGLTFLLYFFFEVLKKLLIHPFQYLLVGLAITIFYLLLLSFSEHLGFNLAYLISAAATVLLITGYSWTVLGIRRLVFQLFGLLVAIYGFIFVLLQLEDYALLAGSVGVFIALAAVMYGSRKVSWYNLGERK